MYEPLQKITPAYPYKGLYREDPRITPYFNSYNKAAQYYLDWYNENPITVYTNPNISGLFLDWVGRGYYNIIRPIISEVTTRPSVGPYNTYAYNTIPYNFLKRFTEGSIEIVNDDIYKRVITWFMYRGDGFQTTVQWLRKRVARFIFGVDGTDVSNDYLQYVSIEFPILSIESSLGPYNTASYNSIPFNSIKKNSKISRRVIVITLQQSIISNIFAKLLQQGLISIPLQITIQVEFS